MNASPSPTFEISMNDACRRIVALPGVVSVMIYHAARDVKWQIVGSDAVLATIGSPDAGEVAARLAPALAFLRLTQSGHMHANADGMTWLGAQESGVYVVACVPVGHAIHKSLRRAIRRAVRPLAQWSP